MMLLEFFIAIPLLLGFLFTWQVNLHHQMRAFQDFSRHERVLFRRVLDIATPEAHSDEIPPRF